MDPDCVKSTLSNLAFGNVMAAAARDYQKEVLAQEKAQASTSVDHDIDVDELMDDPELEKLHADRIAALKKEAEKRQILKRQGHGECREINEAEFLGEVTGSEKVICHFYHREFYRCKIMDKHLKSLAPRYADTKFIKLDAEVSFPCYLLRLSLEVKNVGHFHLYAPVQQTKQAPKKGKKKKTEEKNAPFFVTKLGVKTLPCVVLLRNGIATDRVVGFQDLGGKDDFSTKALEVLLLKKGIIIENKEKEEDDYSYSDRSRTVRSSFNADSDSE